MHVKLPEVASATDAREAARALLDAGVDGIKLYAQTWAPPIVVMPPDAVRGAVEAGMNGRDILASLTTAPAGRFGAASRAGRVAAGLDADIVVLAGDPAADVRAFAAVRYSIRGGRVIYSAPPPLRAR